MDRLDVIDRGGEQFARVLGIVGPEQWSLSTPCEGWDVRELVRHVVGGTIMATRLLEGAGRDEALSEVIEFRLGDDPLAEFTAAMAAVSAAFREPGALDRTCAHPMGDIPADTLLGFRIGDLTLHSWDLAHAIGADETLDPVLVETVWDEVSPMKDGIAASGMFGAGPSNTVADDAPLQVRLLDLTGRRP
jgi:uncharacterized protein (TIGR03086 family)